MNYELDCWDYMSTRDSVLNILQIDLNEFEMLILKLKYLVLIDKGHETIEVILEFLKNNFPIIRIDYVYFYHRTRWHSKNDLMKGLKSNIDFFPEVKKYLQSIFPISLTPIFDQITFQESSFRYSRILDINNRLAKKSQNGPWFFLFGNPEIFGGNFYGRYLERGSELFEQICRIIEEELSYKNALETFIGNTKPFLVKYKIQSIDFNEIKSNNNAYLDCLVSAIKFLLEYDVKIGKYEDSYCFSLKGNSEKAKIVDVISVKM